MAARKKEKNFEGAIDRLEEIVTKMESEELSLEESIDIFKEGMDLVALCNARLDEAEQKINSIVKAKNGEVQEEEFSLQGE
ncbi:exodeoxyribonuclease VII small subunit [Clostridium cylindrosporum]|uniref:Exodeoxyribonuclease 7 small subunit n=1 Tax=Clostridium cylindrosporum DSM 605 TaxID=1121307 RepID=A0A0J8D671_CLOCY|nr:exodeoxyribonuclease VII small subunit [Clostridium cylindrosporum]KMT21352.1 exodeoxyribonuclease VII small subunit [Clostridium cylindrosporum DSM 605]